MGTMKRLLFLPLAFLFGCGSPMKEAVEPPPAPGVGFVQSIESTPTSPAAGGTAGSSTKTVGVRMAHDNSLQYFRTRAVDLKIGERVEITADGHLLHPKP
jgi:hypothetical protein